MYHVYLAFSLFFFFAFHCLYQNVRDLWIGLIFLQPKLQL